MAIVTFTSDVGTGDFVTAAVKGQLLHANPSFTIIDITHNLSPFNFFALLMFAKMLSKTFHRVAFTLYW